MLEHETKELKALTDRELLIEMATIQKFQTRELIDVKLQVDKIETKILDDVSRRVRDLEDQRLVDKSEKKANANFAPNLIKIITVAAAIIGVLIALKPLLGR
jgi:hypothetical protein